MQISFERRVFNQSKTNYNKESARTGDKIKLKKVRETQPTLSRLFSSFVSVLLQRRHNFLLNSLQRGEKQNACNPNTIVNTLDICHFGNN